MSIGLFALDLGHDRPTFSDAVAAEIDAARSGIHGGKETRCSVSDESEPQECGGGLGFATAFSLVVGAVGDAVALDVTLENDQMSVQ